MSKPVVITINALNIQICHRMIEVLEAIARMPDDANIWDATDLAKEVLEDIAGGQDNDTES